ncbi:MAG: ATP-binding protein, partial [Clostridia bacterium]
SRSNRTSGTGLGLSIVKHVAMHHNARIELESQPGHGTTIRIIFPGPHR